MKKIAKITSQTGIKHQISHKNGGLSKRLPFNGKESAAISGQGKVLKFTDKVLRVVAKIPKGKALTYQEVAELAGSPGAFRAVGNIMSNNFDPKIPCHRVVRSDGVIGKYNRGAANKIKLLSREGMALT